MRCLCRDVYYPPAGWLPERHIGRWSVVQISDLGNNTHAIAVKIFDFGNSEPLPTVICNKSWFSRRLEKENLQQSHGT